MQGHKIKEDGKYGLKYFGVCNTKLLHFISLLGCNLSTIFLLEKCYGSQSNISKKGDLSTCQVGFLSGWEWNLFWAGILNFPG